MSKFLQGKLDTNEIKQKLEEYSYSSNYHPSQKVINDIIDQFWFQDYFNSFISDPVFLKYLPTFLNNKELEKFNRYDFYHYFYNAILPKRTVFSEFALKFEVAQTDSLPLKKFNELTKKYKKDVTLEELEKKHLAKTEKRDDGEYFLWEHHTLTEFPAAEHILMDKNPLKRFYELAVIDQEGVIAIKPSWYGVLRFLLESPKGTLFSEWLHDFLKKYLENLDNKIAEILVQENQHASQPLRKQIFHLVYETYSNRLNWIPSWARRRLAIFIDEELYKKLKVDLKMLSQITYNDTQRYVRLGNLVSLIGGLLEYKPPFFNTTEQTFWKEQLVVLSNDANENGVLQRHSLDALAEYHDPSLIPLVAEKNARHKDKLVRDAFFSFCYECAPNSRETIDQLIAGIKGGESIYPRQGLYEISRKDAILHFLEQVAQDEVFWKAFLKHESIFDKESGDKQLLETIQKFLDDKEIIHHLKQIITTVFTMDGYYREGRSHFLKAIFLFINSHDTNFLFELLATIKDEKNIDQLFYDYRDFLALLLTKDNVEAFFEFINTQLEEKKRDAQSIVYFAKNVNGETGEEVYNKALSLRLVDPLSKSESVKERERKELENKKKLYDDFLKKLEPEPGKFMTDVFRFFLNHRKELEPVKKKDKQRLIKLAVEEGIRKIDPQKFHVTIPDKTTESRSFTWSTPASYYGDILDFVREFAPEEIQKNRQKIIDFIPYAFAPSQIFAAFPEIKDNELQFVNKVMLGKIEKNDAMYLIPNSYIYIMEEYAKRGCRLPGVKAVLKSFVENAVMQEYEKRAALRALRYFITANDLETKKWLEDVSAKYEYLTVSVNELLITVYHDESAINWRFEKIKISKEFDSRGLEGIVHSVGPIEEEFMSLKFAGLLIQIDDAKYLPKFFELLDRSFSMLAEKKDGKYWDYVTYLWRIVIAFVEKLKNKGSFAPLLSLEEYVNKNATVENTNWLRGRIIELRKEYLLFIGESK